MQQKIFSYHEEFTPWQTEIRSDSLHAYYFSKTLKRKEIHQKKLESKQNRSVSPQSCKKITFQYSDAPSEKRFRTIKQQNQLKKSYQSRNLKLTSNGSVMRLLELPSKKSPSHFLLSFTNKTRSQKEQRGKTKNLLQSNHSKINQQKINKNQEPFEKIIKKLLNLTKTSYQRNFPNTNMEQKANIFDHTKIQNHSFSKDRSEKQIQINNLSTICRSECFMQRKNIIYIKKRGNQKDFKKPYKLLKSLVMPKIEVLDEDKM